MSRFHLDANAMVALADPTGEVWRLVMEQIQVGALPETSAVAWHEFVRGPLTSHGKRLRALLTMSPSCSIPESVFQPRADLNTAVWTMAV